MYLSPCVLQGLGKRPVTKDRNQHLSENHTSWATTHLCPTLTNTESTYVSDFSQRKHATLMSTPGSDPLRLSLSSPLTHKFHVFSKPSFHRFPRTHRPAAGLDPPPPLFKLTSWFPHEHRGGTVTTTTPLVVLAESQKPFLPHNQWTYSYKSQ